MDGMQPTGRWRDDLRHAVKVLVDGGVVAFATDTLYGLAVDPRSAQAIARLFAVKEREPGHAVPLIAADEQQVQQAGEWPVPAQRLAAAFWPGPLSLVLPASTSIHRDVQAADGSIAVRVPRSDAARALAAAFGFCITSTSANLSGQPPTNSPAVVRATIGARIDFLLDSGDAPGGAPSTIVDARQQPPRLVRAGAVPWDRVLESLQ